MCIRDRSKAVKRAKIGLKTPEGSQRPQEVPPEVPKRLSRTPSERAGTKTREDRTRQEETTEDEDKTSQVKRRPKRQKPAQDKIR